MQTYPCLFSSHDRKEGGTGLTALSLCPMEAPLVVRGRWTVLSLMTLGAFPLPTSAPVVLALAKSIAQCR